VGIVAAIFSRGRPRSAPEAPVVAPPPAIVEDTTRRADSSEAATAQDSSATLAALPQTPANPADSALASAWALALANFNNEDGAKVELDRVRSMPAATYSPIVFGTDRGLWYRLTIGAYRQRSTADSALAALRRTKQLGVRVVTVVSTPFALEVARGVSRDTAAVAANALALRGVPAYGLLQDDGSVTLYAGAFESPEQAGPLSDTFRAAGIAPVVVYRTGRVF
jgi:hypothetical protein